MKGLELPTSLVMRRVRFALEAVDEVGLWSYNAGCQQQQVPTWKKIAYARLLHRMGLVFKFTHWTGALAVCYLLYFEFFVSFCTGLVE